MRSVNDAEHIFRFTFRSFKSSEHRPVTERAVVV